MNEDDNKGKYPYTYLGTVVTNIDPLKQGRLLVKVPDVLSEDPCIWAVSASPIAGMYTIPTPGDGVWVIFQDGDPNYAVWIGSWRGSSVDVPAQALTASPLTPPIILQSLAQNRIVISSTPGQGIVLETAAGELGPRIEISSTGITISAGLGLASIELKGPIVDINNNALKVLGP
jgi:hypothetical protein